jgi:4-amino-4-deoxy-L-arabinose transferase-like glycosyltransferase
VKRTRRPSFGVVLLLITLGAFGLRVGYTLTVTGTEHYVYDWIFYRGEARALAQGYGFVEPRAFGHARPATMQPAADHPPLLSIVLAPIAKLSLDDDTPMRVFNCILGALGVALIGLLGREIGGDDVGIAAAGIAALYPNLWVNDALIMPESLTVVVATAALLLALRFKRKPTTAGAAAVGAVCGIAALTRSELVLLVPALCIPAVLLLRDVARKQRIRLLLVALLAVAVVVGPWIGYNQTRFERPVLISTNFDLNLLGSSCPDVYHDPYLGMLGFCTFLKIPPGKDASEGAAIERKQALSYIRDNLRNYPTIVAARIGRTWSLYRPLDGEAVGEAEGRPSWVTILGLIAYYPLLLLAIAGVQILRRRRASVWQLLVLPAVVTASMLVSYGQTRYRVSAEPIIVVLAAVALVALASSLRARRSAGTGSITAPARLPVPSEAGGGGSE